MRKPLVGAVIAAGGMAQRMQGIDKQQLVIGGVPVLARSILALGQVEQVGEIVVVTKPELFETLEGWRERYHLPPFLLAAGGSTRQQSVQAGVAMLSEQVEYVAIHDGARPFATRELIERCLQSAIEHGAATAAVRAKDTIKVSAQDGSIESTPDRSRLYLTQTPQIFSLALYKKAVRQAQQEKLDFTDDCQLVEHIGQKVWLSEGDYQNIKITTPEDMVLAEAIARQQDTQQRGEKREMEIRAGHGYDVHRLVEGRKLILGGVTIPWEKGLLGHSDADVLTHAVMDALLGAAGAGGYRQALPGHRPALCRGGQPGAFAPCGEAALPGGLRDFQYRRHRHRAAAKAQGFYPADAAEHRGGLRHRSRAGQCQGHHRGKSGFHRLGRRDERPQRLHPDKVKRTGTGSPA